MTSLFMLSAIRENVRLAPYTTFRIGGIARYFCDVTNEDQLREGLNFAKQLGLPIFVLGGGSNVLIADIGFRGVVLFIALKGITFQKPRKNSVLVTAAAGEVWDKFVQQCVERNLAGVECLSGIPGFVGGTPIQNVGAYGQDVSETIVSVRAFDREKNRVVELTNEACQFNYRTSIFNTTERDRYVVLEVTYKLQLNGEPALRYPDLQKFFAAQKTPPTLAEARAAVLQIRSDKGMVIKPNDSDCQSAGSFFKNPVISAEEFSRVEEAAHKLNLLPAGERVPHFDAPDQRIKVPAAWLIEKAGFPKGYSRGRVGISTKHTLAVTNRNNATATEILEFARKIQTQIREKFGVTLTPEPILIGVE